MLLHGEGRGRHTRSFRPGLCQSTITRTYVDQFRIVFSCVGLDEIEAHLQSMLRVLRPQDTLSMAVRLQSSVDDHARYLAVVSTTDPSEHRESALIGFDCGKDKISYVFVLKQLTPYDLF